MLRTRTLIVATALLAPWWTAGCENGAAETPISPDPPQVGSSPIQSGTGTGTNTGTGTGTNTGTGTGTSTGGEQTPAGGSVGDQDPDREEALSRVPVRVEGSHFWGQVSVGDDFACAVTTAGVAYCWEAGYDYDDYYGYDDDRYDAFRDRTPTRVAGNHLWEQVSAGDDFACGVVAGQAAYCWGAGDRDDDDDYYERDDDYDDRGGPPVRVPGNHAWRQVSVGDDFACGVTTGGAAWCWGAGEHYGDDDDDDDYYERDDDDYDDQGGLPVRVPGNHAWRQVSVGDDFACGVTAGGATWCWGAGEGYEDDDDDYYERYDDDDDRWGRQPVRIEGNHAWRQLSAGDHFVCGVDAESAAHCWGGGEGYDDDDSYYGRSDDAWSPRPAPVEGGHAWRQLSAGDDFACGVDAESTAWCWDSGERYYYDDDSYYGREEPWGRTPIRIAGNHPWEQVSAGDHFACGVVADGAIYCWTSGPDRSSS